MKRCFLVILTLIMHPVAFARLEGQQLIDSLLRQLMAAREDTNKVKLMDQLAYTYANIDPDKGIEYGEKTLALSQKLNWPKGIAVANADLGINYETKSDHKSALNYEITALHLYNALKDDVSVAGMLNDIALIYMAQSDYPTALDYHFRALNIYEKIGAKEHSAIASENIGGIYAQLKKYDDALAYYNKAVSVFKETGNKTAYARSIANMAIVLDARGEYNKALNDQLIALNINKELGNRNTVQINLANIGYIYCHKADFVKALKYQLDALKMSEGIGNRNSVAINLGNIGETYFAMATDTSGKVNNGSIPASKVTNLHTAVSYLEQAVSICEETNFRGPLMEFSKYLSDAYAILGDYKDAFRRYSLYADTKDSVFSVEKRVQLANLEAKRALELKDKDLQIKEDQIRIQELEIQKKSKNHILFVIGLISLLLIVCIVLKLLYDYRRSNRVLQREKNKYLLQITEQVEHIKKQTSVLKEISRMQAHEVRGPVASILGLIQLFNFEDPADPVNKTVIEGITTLTAQLDEAVKEVIRKENNLEL